MPSLSACALLVVLFAACGGDSIGDGGVACDGASCAQPPACNPDNCNGCCVGDACVVGTAASACGAGGAQCEICAMDASCKSGRCVPPCSEASCAGCCAADGSCQPGSSDSAACGRSGAACQPCGANLACAAGHCVAATCAATCANCCKADGTCRALDDTSAGPSCGRRGGSCDTCLSTASCDSGACVPTTCRDNCLGGCCLADGTCLPGDTVAACGSAGASCDVCGTWACVAGMRDQSTVSGVQGVRGCYLPATSSFDVVLLDASLPDKTESGDSWDVFGGLPDPYLIGQACNAAHAVNTQQSDTSPATSDCLATVRTPTYNDSLSVSFANQVLFSGIAAPYLHNLSFQFNDEDIAVRDWMVICELAIGPTLEQGGFARYQSLLDGDTLELGCHFFDDVAKTPVGKLHIKIRPHL